VKAMIGNLILLLLILASPKPILTLQPEVVEAEPGEAVEVQVILDPGLHGVSAIDLELTFPKGLDVEMEMGSLLGSNPVVAVMEVEASRLRVAAARRGVTEAPTPKGVLMTLHITVGEECRGILRIDFSKAVVVDESFNKLEADLKGCEIRVIEAATLNLRVLDQRGKPIAGAWVELDGVEGLTDSLGRLTLRVRPGAYTVRVGKEGYEEHSESIILKPGASKSLEVRLKRHRRCLIATAAYGSELAPQVEVLRGFRDNYILSTSSGEAFMEIFNAWYYSWSPYVAEAEERSPTLRALIKASLYPFIGCLLLSQGVYDALSSTPELAVVATGITISLLLGLIYLTPPTLPILLKLRRKPDARIPLTALLIALTLHFTALRLGYLSVLYLSGPLIVLSSLSLPPPLVQELLRRLRIHVKVLRGLRA